MDALSREEEAKLAIEKLQASLKEDLVKAAQEQDNADQKVRCTDI